MTAIEQYILKPSSTLATKRSVTSSISGTYKSAKHWNTCMDNRPCKIIAIVLIVIVALLAFWLIGFVFKAIRNGCEGVYGLFCWPCSSCSNTAQTQPTVIQQQPPVIYQQQTQPAYAPARNDYSRVYEDGYQMESAQDFDLEEQKRKSVMKKQATDTKRNNDDESWYNYNPFSADNKQSKY